MNKVDEKLFDKYSYGTSRDTSKQINRGAFENLLSERDAQRVCANCKHCKVDSPVHNSPDCDADIGVYTIENPNYQSCIYWKDKDESGN